MTDPGPVFRRGDRVALRTLQESDAQFVQRLLNDPAVRHGTGHYEPTTLSGEREYLEELREADEDVPFLVTADGDRIGVAGVTHVDETLGVGEVGYFYEPDAWGNGYATEALSCLVAYAFDERRLHKLYADLFADNDGSRRVLEKVGFREEGRFREHHYRDGEYVDRLRYGLLDREWRDGDR